MDFWHVALLVLLPVWSLLAAAYVGLVAAEAVRRLCRWVVRVGNEKGGDE